VPLLKYVAESKELDIYQKDMIIDFISYKWQYVGRRVQIVSFIFHFTYMFLLAWYVNMAYYDVKI